jgi:hypothetical protein
MSVQVESSAVFSASRQPRSLARWLVCGAAVGGLFGAGYAAVWLGIADESGEPAQLVAATAAVAAAVGAAIAAWQHTGRPQECSLGTSIGFLTGLMPALVMSVASAGLLEFFRRPTALAGLALAPAMAGFLLGGLLDRFLEPWLLAAPTDGGEQT